MTDHDFVKWAEYFLGIDGPEIVEGNQGFWLSEDSQREALKKQGFEGDGLVPEADRALYGRVRECVGLRTDAPAPHGHVLPPRANTPSTGYRGGIGYGWLGYEAGQTKRATVLDYIRGRTVNPGQAAELVAAQERRAAANAQAFHEYLRA